MKMTISGNIWGYSKLNPHQSSMTSPRVEKVFCTTREAAELLGVSIGTVQIWVENDLLQAWKTVGGHRRVFRSSVEQLLHKRSEAPLLPPKSAERQMSVLVVEDDHALLQLYRFQLSRWPMKPELITVDNAVSALLAMGRGGPDLLVADMNLPFIDGFEMLRILRQAPELSATTIVVVSGLDDAEIRRRGPVPAGIEILPKPIPFDRLLAIATRIHH